MSQVVLITRPIGACNLPYAVSAITRTALRIAHVANLATAKAIKADWERGNFNGAAGVGECGLRPLGCSVE